ncbi:MAG TPA: UDP-N-acetylmuramoyl-L-alanine--D-glutamate ligase [Steroidobacteraceae bacterium]|nr:UDP-N-acetylmuramoyl-L-alanine--D-glutamate ligase [Steroidobacteraceae bacterium]
MNDTRKPAAAVIVGLGATGLSCARYLKAGGWRISVTDTRADPPGKAALAQLDPQAPTRFGALDTGLLDDALCVVASPGVPLSDPFFAEARRRGIDVAGDIELFARAADAPVAGITGTNGKSTVTTLVGRMAAAAGLNVRVGGNLGEPALELLQAARADARPTDLYVLELSSYQLEAAWSLALKAAAVLNVSPDHLDRYAGLADYAAAKARIFARCDTAVVNLDDALVTAMPRSSPQVLGFSLQPAAGADYTLADRAALGDVRRSGFADAAGWWLTRRGEPLMPLAALKIRGLHNASNALAALAMAEALGLPRASTLAALAAFEGLPHRSQWVANVGGVAFVDDSKGTNVGATLAAVAGLPGPVVIIAGGDGKAQDFAPLAAAFRGKVRHAVLIGRDAAAIAAALEGVCSIETCGSMPEAVRAAARAARSGDTVLLSPACASLDMFRNYAHRGEVFAQAVRELAA